MTSHTSLWLPSVEEAASFLKKQVVGQDHAIAAVVKHYGFFRSGFKNFNEETRRRPIGVFLFTGPSKVGKTELAKSLGRLFYGTADAITILPMSSYQEPHMISNLIGSPHGYVGYGDPPELSKQKLYSRIPGRPERPESKTSSKPVREKSPDNKPGDGMIFLAGQNIMLSLQRGSFELALYELNMIDLSIAVFSDEILAMERAETSNGKRSYESEKEKADLKERLRYLTIRKRIIILQYYQSVLQGFKENYAQEEAVQDADKEKDSPAPVQDTEPILIIVLDEIEKAHPKIWNFFLHAFQEGKVPLCNTEETDFSRTIFIMTSNLGAGEATKMLEGKVGFAPSDKKKDVEVAIGRELKKTFKPEFLNRINEIITFHHLTTADLKAILKMQSDEFKRGLEGQLIGLDIAPEAEEYIIVQAENQPRAQAQGVLKYFQDLISIPIGELFCQGKIEKGQTVMVKVKKNKITFDIISLKPAK